jgi:DNA-binding MarR family transcriptional regulator
MLMLQHQHVDPPGAGTLDPVDLYELLSAVHHVCRREIDERVGVFGMSAVQWRALQVIREHPSFPQRWLAKEMAQSPQAFGTLLARLQLRGHVVRRRARRYAATHDLSASGRIMLLHAQEIAEDVLALLFMPLTREERRSLQALLEKVLKARWRLQFHPLPENP